MLVLSTPCTAWSLLFTHLAGGDVYRHLARLPWNLVLQLVLLPLYLSRLTPTLVPLHLNVVAQAFALPSGKCVDAPPSTPRATTPQ